MLKSPKGKPRPNVRTVVRFPASISGLSHAKPYKPSGGDVYQGIKQQGRESNHYLSSPSYAFVTLTETTPYFRNLDAEFSVQRFVSRTNAVNVSFVVGKMWHMDNPFSKHIGFPWPVIIPPTFHKLLSSPCVTIDPSEVTLTKDSISHHSYI